MGFKECQYCHRFFPSDIPNADTCDSCRSEIEHDRQLCRSYLERHNGASIMEIHIATNLPIKSINRLLEIGAISYK